MISETTASYFQLIELLVEEPDGKIYRAIDPKKKMPVIIKILKEGTSSSIDRIKHEFEILQQLNTSFVLKGLDLIFDSNQWILVMEDFKSKSLLSLKGTL